MVHLLGGVPFESLGTIHERVLLWKALDAFMLVVAWSSVTRVVAIPVEAHSPAPFYIGLPVKHWLKSEVSIADQSLLSVASTFWQ